VCCITVFFI